MLRIKTHYFYLLVVSARAGQQSLGMEIVWRRRCRADEESENLKYLHTDRLARSGQWALDMVGVTLYDIMTMCDTLLLVTGCHVMTQPSCHEHTHMWPDLHFIRTRSELNICHKTDGLDNIQTLGLVDGCWNYDFSNICKYFFIFNDTTAPGAAKVYYIWLLIWWPNIFPSFPAADCGHCEGKCYQNCIMQLW